MRSSVSIIKLYLFFVTTVTQKYIQFGYHAEDTLNEEVYHWNCTGNPDACFVTDPWQPSVKNHTQGTIAFGAVYESKDAFCKDINPDVCFFCSLPFLEENFKWKVNYQDGCTLGLRS